MITGQEESNNGGSKEGEIRHSCILKESVEDAKMGSQRWNMDMSQPQLSGGLR